MTHYLDAAMKAARAAGEMLRHDFAKPQRVNATTKHDIKLEIDVRAQDLITERLLAAFPQHALYGEEGSVGDQSSEFQWVVDPLDGTVNFYYGIPHFCVSIALRFSGEIIVGVIYDPIRDELWAGQKGERPQLNGNNFSVSQRADLSEAVVSVDAYGTRICSACVGSRSKGIPVEAYAARRVTAGDPDHFGGRQLLPHAARRTR